MTKGDLGLKYFDLNLILDWNYNFQILLIFIISDPALVAMVANSVAADGGESSYFDAPISSSQGKSVRGSQSPVLYGSQIEDFDWGKVSYGQKSSSFEAFVPGSTESTTARYVCFFSWKEFIYDVFKNKSYNSYFVLGSIKIIHVGK